MGTFSGGGGLFCSPAEWSSPLEAAHNFCRCAWRVCWRPLAAALRLAAPWRSFFVSSRSELTKNGAPERIRTSDPQIRSLVLYPAELRVRFGGANLFISPPKGKDNPALAET